MNSIDLRIVGQMKMGKRYRKKKKKETEIYEMKKNIAAIA